ncbi:HesA/MoeB/ThiF family protein [Soonwooa sp.]|uniref:HesA/MoeB/ThiF family protein n=1 Tax=Soonwooa sp. TaxID=1938592 RepID=UPI0028AFD5A9|nr:HesA/MoeB/ThiF family protein [Soonwooa sp.]
MKNEEFTRYSRQIFMDEIGVEGQNKILSAKVLVIGAGGLGSPVIQYLAAAGVGKIGVADFDEVEIHNLNRQIIHTENSVGTSKVDSAQNFVQNINSNVEFIGFKSKITSENANSILKEFDVIVDASDNFATRYLLNDTCVQLNKTLVYGSILGFEGQVAVFNYQGSKNLRDIFPDCPETALNCDKNGVLGALPGIVGSFMAMNTLKIICKLPVKTNQLLIIDTLNWNFTQVDF